jgi:hypothetical protein
MSATGPIPAIQVDRYEKDVWTCSFYRLNYLMAEACKTPGFKTEP